MAEIWLVSKAMMLHYKTILVQEQPGLMSWIFGMNDAPGAGSIAQPVDRQSSTLPLCYGCPHKWLSRLKYLKMALMAFLLIDNTTHKRLDRDIQTIANTRGKKGYGLWYQDIQFWWGYAIIYMICYNIDNLLWRVIWALPALQTQEQLYYPTLQLPCTINQKILAPLQTFSITVNSLCNKIYCNII